MSSAHGLNHLIIGPSSSRSNVLNLSRPRVQEELIHEFRMGNSQNYHYAKKIRSKETTEAQQILSLRLLR